MRNVKFRSDGHIYLNNQNHRRRRLSFLPLRMLDFVRPFKSEQYFKNKYEMALIQRKQIVAEYLQQACWKDLI